MSRCVACHSDGNEDGVFEAGLFSGMDVDAFTYPDPSQFSSGGSYSIGEYSGADVEDLSRFIFDVMNIDFVNCDQQCSDDTAAYMWSLRDGVVGAEEVLAFSCPNPTAIHYGKRTLR